MIFETMHERGITTPFPQREFRHLDEDSND
jgi:small-conductance mechanosensitive channel